jgi:hypothetical protein
LNLVQVSKTGGEYTYVDILLSGVLFGIGGSKVIEPIASISQQLSKEEYHSLVEPTINKMFSIPDRSIRHGLLEHMTVFISHMDVKSVTNNIFPHYVG